MRLDHTNPDSLRKTRRDVESGLRDLRANLISMRMHHPSSNDELDVRLVSDHDGEIWFATGDVGYDTAHGAACEAAVITTGSTDDDLIAMATQLVAGVADLLAEFAELEAL